MVGLPPARVLVLDLDGTLVDTVPDLAAALNRLMTGRRLAGFTFPETAAMVGDGVARLVEKAFAARGTTPDQAAIADFSADYAASAAVDSRLYPHVLTTLGGLLSEGWRLAVCTNKRHDLAIQLLDALNLTRRFAAIVGADAVVNKKPHPDHFIETVSRAGGELGRSVMVGDSTTDVKSAQGAGAPVIVYRPGYGDVAADDMGADAIIDDYAILDVTAEALLARA